MMLLKITIGNKTFSIVKSDLESLLVRYRSNSEDANVIKQMLSGEKTKFDKVNPSLYKALESIAKVEDSPIEELNIVDFSKDIEELSNVVNDNKLEL